jgi:hypothetical protein
VLFRSERGLVSLLLSVRGPWSVLFLHPPQIFTHSPAFTRSLYLHPGRGRVFFPISFPVLPRPLPSIQPWAGWGCCSHLVFLGIYIQSSPQALHTPKVCTQNSVPARFEITISYPTVSPHSHRCPAFCLSL